MGFIDPGGDHVHIILNEGSVNAQTIAVQLISGRPAMPHRCSGPRKL